MHTAIGRSPEVAPRAQLPERWYLSANRSEAVLYRAQSGEGLVFLHRFRNPEGRLTERELTSDRPGRKQSGAGARNHGAEPRGTQHERIGEEFAREVAEVLGRAADAGEFEELVAVAEPHFLGLLRNSWQASVTKRLTRTVPHECSHDSLEAFETYMRQKLELKDLAGLLAPAV